MLSVRPAKQRGIVDTRDHAFHATARLSYSRGVSPVLRDVCNINHVEKESLKFVFLLIDVFILFFKKG